MAWSAERPCCQEGAGAEPPARAGVCALADAASQRQVNIVTVPRTKPFVLRGSVDGIIGVSPTVVIAFRFCLPAERSAEVGDRWRDNGQIWASAVAAIETQSGTRRSKSFAVSYFRAAIVILRCGVSMALRRESLFATMARNALSAAEFFQLPPICVGKLGHGLRFRAKHRQFRMPKKLDGRELQIAGRDRQSKAAPASRPSILEASPARAVSAPLGNSQSRPGAVLRGSLR